VQSIKLAMDDLDNTTALQWDVGLFTTAGAAIDADCYANNITAGQAATAFTEYAFTTRDIDKCGQKVWQDADTTATADPGGFYYLGLTVSTVAGTEVAGTISWQVEYAE
jgi:hypothetical protein